MPAASAISTMCIPKNLRRFIRRRQTTVVAQVANKVYHLYTHKADKERTIAVGGRMIARLPGRLGVVCSPVFLIEERQCAGLRVEAFRRSHTHRDRQTETALLFPSLFGGNRHCCPAIRPGDVKRTEVPPTGSVLRTLALSKDCGCAAPINPTSCCPRSGDDVGGERTKLACNQRGVIVLGLHDFRHLPIPDLEDNIKKLIKLPLAVL
ncbi:unnamed protein product [Dibothriocephalus latus]|uniref:Uncharacterized protein n=1 Tax=Dibothriocephalus latus TaxID=60516 RepID=A0A3P6U9N5_DIBLA|nr:unnamed protein product [Dibothriocephalus latus]